MDNQLVKWLLFQGLIPLTGAGLMYTFWGCCQYVVCADKNSFSYQWRMALDPLGWLYGAMIIAVQAAQMSFSVQDDHLLAWGCIGGVLACLGLLFAAMTNKGTNPTWAPPASLHVFSIIVVLAILYASYSASYKVNTAKPAAITAPTPAVPAPAPATTGGVK